MFTDLFSEMHVYLSARKKSESGIKGFKKDQGLSIKCSILHFHVNQNNEK